MGCWALRLPERSKQSLQERTHGQKGGQGRTRGAGQVGAQGNGQTDGWGAQGAARLISEADAHDSEPGSPDG
jgi:hypothetical protein